jgi:hypothetical protein
MASIVAVEIKDEVNGEVGAAGIMLGPDGEIAFNGR